MKLDNQYSIKRDNYQWILVITSLTQSVSKETNEPTGTYPSTQRYYANLAQLAEGMVYHNVPHVESILELKAHIDAKVEHLIKCLEQVK